MSKFSVILLSICLLDSSGTALGIYLGYFKEANPILNYFLEHWGLFGFIVPKIFFVIFLISILETAPRFNLLIRSRIEIYYKITIFGYIFILGGGILYLN